MNQIGTVRYLPVPCAPVGSIPIPGINEGSKVKLALHRMRNEWWNGVWLNN